jgi:uncharacterized damage-inducible protein DinB
MESWIKPLSYRSGATPEMNPSLPAIGKEFCRAASAELEDAMGRIEHCLDQLSSSQLWWRPNESMNSIANLVLHVCGNVRQWIVAGVGESPDQRNRPLEFSQREGLSVADLKTMLRDVAIETRKTLDGVTEQELLRQRNIQGFAVTGLQAVLESVAHFRGHTQEIVHLTRIQLGEDYQFDFVPGPEQHGGGSTTSP